jgi:hypothetical protein
LAVAVICNKICILEILLERSPPLTVEESGYLLTGASASGKTDIVLLLLKFGVKTSVYNHRALFYAIESGHAETARVLLENGADWQDARIQSLRQNPFYYMHIDNCFINGHRTILALLREFGYRSAWEERIAQIIGTAAGLVCAVLLVLGLVLLALLALLLLPLWGPIALGGIVGKLAGREKAGYLTGYALVLGAIISLAIWSILSSI